VRPEGLGKFEKVTSLGIEPSTFRYIAYALTTTLPHARKFSQYELKNNKANLILFQIISNYNKFGF
jgi:hypothetical protein